MKRLRDIIEFEERPVKGTPDVNLTARLRIGASVEVSANALEPQRGRFKEVLMAQIAQHLYGKIERPLHRIVMIALEASRRGVWDKDRHLEITELETDILRIITGYTDLT